MKDNYPFTINKGYRDSMKRICKIYCFLLFLMIMFYSGIFLAPYLYNKNILLSTIIYSIYKLVCHQMPSRSFFIFNHKMAVCARCFGIYTGFLAGMLIYPFVKKLNDFKTPNKWYLIMALIPMGIDGTTQLIGLRESFNELRLITGLIAGFVGVFYVLPVFLSVMTNILNDKTIKNKIKI